MAPGFQLRDFTYGQSGLFSTAELSRDANARTRLVRDVVGGHPDTATLVTPPHFYVEDDHGFELNIALAEEALQTSSVRSGRSCWSTASTQTRTLPGWPTPTPWRASPDWSCA